jgi:hypothetical protein
LLLPQPLSCQAFALLPGGSGVTNRRVAIRCRSLSCRSGIPISLIPKHLQMPSLQTLSFQFNTNCPGGVPPFASPNPGPPLVTPGSGFKRRNEMIQYGPNQVDGTLCTDETARGYKGSVLGSSERKGKDQ